MTDNEQLLMQLRESAHWFQTHIYPEEALRITQAADTIESLERELAEAQSPTRCGGSGIRPPDGVDQMGLPRWGPEEADNRVDRSCPGCIDCKAKRNAAVLEALTSEGAIQRLHDGIFGALKHSAEDCGPDETHGEAVKRVLKREIDAIQHAQESEPEKRDERLDIAIEMSAPVELTQGRVPHCKQTGDNDA